jgi:hypothetical protein
MKSSYRVARAPNARRPMLAAVVLLVLLAQTTACQPDPAPVPGDSSPEQPTHTPDQPTDATSPQTSPFTLAFSPQDPDYTPDPKQPGGGAFLGVLTTNSALASLDFRYDAYIVTARESGAMIIKSEVLEANPAGYRYGYGYPLSMTAIEDGVSLTQYGGSYVQDALETGTAIIEYPVRAGRQYILVYKTFGSFTPLTYRLTLPSALTVEGRIHQPPEPVPAPPSSGIITLENPRPDALSRFVPWLSERVNGS